MRTAVRAHWARIRVFITCFVAVIPLGVICYLLTGGSLFTAKVTIKTYLDDSGGVESGATVQLNGVKIGKVESINLSHVPDPRKVVEVRMRIQRRFLDQIPEDSGTELAAENLLGDKFIDITRGKSPRPLRENGALAQKPAGTAFNRLDLTGFETELRTIDALLRDIQAGKGPLGEFVMGDQVYRDLVSKVASFQKDVEAVASAESTMGNLLYGQDVYNDLSARLARLDAALAEIQTGRNPAGQFLRDPAQYEQWRNQVADVRRAVDNAGETGFLKTDDLYATLVRQVASLIRSVDDFNMGKGAGEMLVNAQTYESAVGAAREMESTLRDFRTNPRKYLRLKVF